MEIKTRTLRVFCAVIESGSLQAASARVGLTPSAISRILTQLEAEIGVTFFDRSERRMAPTAHGSEFHARARETLSLCDELGRFGRDLGKRGRQPLRIAALSRHAETIVAPTVARLLADDPGGPGFRIDVHTQRDFGFSKLARPFDVGFGNLIGRHDDLVIEPMAMSPIVVVLPPRHPLALRIELDIGDLADARLIMLSTDTTIGALVQANLQGMPSQNATVTVSHTSVALRLVADGVGLHVTDRLAALQAMKSGCVLIPLASTKPVRFCSFRPRRAAPDDAALIGICKAVAETLRMSA